MGMEIGPSGAEECVHDDQVKEDGEEVKRLRLIFIETRAVAN